MRPVKDFPSGISLDVTPNVNQRKREKLLEKKNEKKYIGKIERFKSKKYLNLMKNKKVFTIQNLSITRGLELYY